MSKVKNVKHSRVFHNLQAEYGSSRKLKSYKAEVKAKRYTNIEEDTEELKATDLLWPVFHKCWQTIPPEHHR